MPKPEPKPEAEKKHDAPAKKDRAGGQSPGRKGRTGSEAGRQVVDGRHPGRCPSESCRRRGRRGQGLGGAKKPSTADILAAARAKAAAAPVAKAAAPAPAAEKPAAKPAPEPGKKLSTADILAAARAKKAAEATAAAAPPAAAAPVEEAPAEEPAVEAAPVPAKAAAKKAAGGEVPTTTAEKIAWCREHDAK